jgi:N-acetylglucosamine-6-phosphate deacetylase
MLKTPRGFVDIQNNGWMGTDFSQPSLSADAFITDGHHLPDDLIKVALRAKTLDRFIVTSDASPLAGMPPGKYTIFGTLAVDIDDTGLIYSEQSRSW